MTCLGRDFDPLLHASNVMIRRCVRDGLMAPYHQILELPCGLKLAFPSAVVSFPFPVFHVVQSMGGSVILVLN